MDKQNKAEIINLLLKCLKQESEDTSVTVNDLSVKTSEGKVKFKIDVEGSMNADNIEEILKLFI